MGRKGLKHHGVERVYLALTSRPVCHQTGQELNLKLEVKTMGGGTVLAGLLSDLCSVSFLYSLGPPAEEWCLPQWTWPSYQLEIKNMSKLTRPMFILSIQLESAFGAEAVRLPITFYISSIEYILWTYG